MDVDIFLICKLIFIHDIVIETNIRYIYINGNFIYQESDPLEI